MQLSIKILNLHTTIIPARHNSLDFIIYANMNFSLSAESPSFIGLPCLKSVRVYLSCTVDDSTTITRGIESQSLRMCMSMKGREQKEFWLRRDPRRVGRGLETALIVPAQWCSCTGCVPLHWEVHWGFHHWDGKVSVKRRVLTDQRWRDTWHYAWVTTNEWMELHTRIILQRPINRLIRRISVGKKERIIHPRVIKSVKKEAHLQLTILLLCLD